jgi:hypothetical protein
MYLGHSTAQEVSTWLLTKKASSRTHGSACGILVDTMALAQGLVRLLSVSSCQCVSIAATNSLLYHLGAVQWALYLPQTHGVTLCQQYIMYFKVSNVILSVAG